MKVLLFGTGDYYNRYKKWFERQEVVALLDNSEQKQHTFIDGIKVLPPKEGVRLDYDIIVILSFYVKQMRQQLGSLGVDLDKIYHFYDLHRLIELDAERRQKQFFLNAREIVDCKTSVIPKILLLSHDMTLGGPAIALFHAACVLKGKGYVVVFASMFDGPLRKQLITNNIPVIVDENLQIATMQKSKWVRAFSLLICNTLNFHVFLSEREIDTPVIWWLHDARFFYDGVNKEVFRKIRLDNLKAVSVGTVPAEAVREFLPEMECDQLLYGVDDIGYGITENREDDRIQFITIGFFEDIKGQDVLVQAVRKLPDAIRKQCWFYMVGHNKTLFGERIFAECVNMDEVIFTGSVDRQEIHRLLSDSDVLICPSRQDSMPTVAAEAMMHSVPCIVSNATGTASYIYNGNDGFIFPNEDVQALAGRIEWCVTNKAELQSIGKRARKLYEEYFSMTAFERRFMEVLHEALRKK